MLFSLTQSTPLAMAPLAALGWLSNIWPYLLLAFGFSVVIFVHELGHFLAAKWAGVRVERFAIGFGKELLGFTRGETRYSLNALPLGGYVKMLGQEDFVVDKSGELKVKDDPTSFTNKSVGKRMVIVSAGVIMNLFFAAAALTIVAMVGRIQPPAIVGIVLPDSPAGRAGLQTGDRILAINGGRVDDFESLKHKVILSDSGEVFELAVERDGKRVQPDPRIIPEYRSAAKEQQLGFTPGMNLRVADAALVQSDKRPPDALHEKDELYRLVQDGEDIVCKDLGRYRRAVLAARGAPVDVVVRRPRDPDALTNEQLGQYGPDVESDELRLKLRAAWFPLPYNPDDPSTMSLLGLVPRLTVLRVVPDKSFDNAGVRTGDIVNRIGQSIHPMFTAFKKEITNNPDRELSIEVCRIDEENRGLSSRGVRFCVEHREALIAAARDGLEKARRLLPRLAAEVNLPEKDRAKITAALGASEDASAWRRWLDRVDVHELHGLIPKRPFALFSTPAPTIDVQAVAFDQERLLVADVLEHLGDRPTPAAEAGIPAGAVIASAEGQPVQHWYELSEVFRKNAGRTVQLTYRLADEVHTAAFRVPGSLSAALDLPFGARIIKIDGKSSCEISGGKGGSRDLPLPDWRAVAGLLEASVDKTVPVEYVTVDGERRTGQFHVTGDSTDPWLQRVQFIANFACYPLLERHPVHNPIRAVGVGFRGAYEWTVFTIETVRHLILTRNVSVEKVSGPVGIIAIGGRVAQSGLTNLLWFLGVISANLAVINFLPMPIVDGGLMVFLLLEKIRGEPVSIKTQVATQLVGIALIATLFILITYQDILKLVGV